MTARRNIGQHPLVEYDWDERTGNATLTYVDGTTQRRPEPMRPGQRDWARLGTREMRSRETTGILALIGERVEAQVAGVDTDYCWQYI